MNIDSLLAGRVFQNLNSPHLIPFLHLIKSKVYSTFSEGDPCAIASSLPSEILMARMKLLRDEIKFEQSVLDLFLPIWSDLGFDLKEIYLDAIRIRCVPDKFHLNDQAASVSFIHRDPWYANPQCQLNFWIPIFDVEKGSGFKIYSSYFSKAVKNNSEKFDYEEWISLGGFQSSQVTKDKKQFFPHPLEVISDSEEIDIFGREGEFVAFASHHLHGTSPNLSGKARFTLEVRFVLKSHLENRMGPFKCDNHSKGSTLQHMYDLFHKRPVSETLIKHYEAGFVPR